MSFVIALVFMRLAVQLRLFFRFVHVHRGIKFCCCHELAMRKRAACTHDWRQKAIFACLVSMWPLVLPPGLHQSTHVHQTHPNMEYLGMAGARTAHHPHAATTFPLSGTCLPCLAFHGRGPRVAPADSTDSRIRASQSRGRLLIGRRGFCWLVPDDVS